MTRRIFQSSQRACVRLLMSVCLLVSGAQSSRASSPCVNSTMFIGDVDQVTSVVPRRIATGDFNGDNVPDIAIASASQLLIRLGSRLNAMQNSYHDDALYPAVGPASGQPSNANTIVVSDVDLDGILDVLLACTSGDGGVLFYRGTGSNHVGNGGFMAPVQISFGSVEDLAVGDVTGDGVPDLVFGNGNGGLYVYRGITNAGIPTGQFTFFSGILTLEQIAQMRLVDVDQDGLKDVIAIFSSNSTLAVHRGLGSQGVPYGQFAPAQATGFRGFTRFCVDDLDGDGDPDMIGCRYTTSQKVFLRGGPGAAFDSVGVLIAGFGTRAIQTADFDHDGRTDIMFTELSGTYSTLLNDQSGPLPLGFSVGPGFTNNFNGPFAIADLNLDGSPDVATFYEFGSTPMRTYLNQCNTGWLTLGLGVDGAGTVAAQPVRVSYFPGDSVTVGATPAAGWRFDHWTPLANSTQNPVRFAIQSNLSLVAHFVPDVYTLTASIAGPGTVLTTPANASGSSFARGTAVSVLAVPSPGAHFIGWTGDITTDSFVVHVSLDQNLSVTAHFASNLALEEGSESGEVRLSAVRPNPLRHGTTVHYRLPHTAMVRLQVLDASGRLVSTIVETVQDAGAHHAEWDLTDRGGARLAPGTYWVQLRAGEAQRTKRVTLIE